MAVSSGISSILSFSLVVFVFSGMQMFKTQLASTQLMTILGGYLGSVLFILTLTAIGNAETSFFGRSFQAQLFPEVVLCMLVALVTSGLIHRVCFTTCLIFSLVGLYYMSKISSQTYSNQSSGISQKSKRK